MDETLKRKVYKYRLYPTRKQERQLTETLDTCRNVYNSFLNSRNAQYDITGKSPSAVDQKNAMVTWKANHPELTTVHSQVLQNVADRVDLAFRAFFRRVKSGETPGFPRFKRDGYDSFTYPQSGYAVHANAVYLSKIGQVKAVTHRAIPGRIKTCNVRRQSGKWFVCFACDYEPEPLPQSSLAVGIDVGLTHFAALSDGTFIDNPRFFRADEAALAKAGRKQAKTANGSQERRKANKVLSRIHERIRNRRHDFCHQNARRIVNKFGLIVVEDLNIKGMVKNHCLAKSISDAAWGMFLNLTQSKAASAAREHQKRNPAFTSQDCYKCGHRAKKKLSERWHNCPNCAASLDRDTNSGLNLVIGALATCVGQYTVDGLPS